ncbi:MAG: putative amidase [Acidobacteria bacterium]|nr:putative amidase [Acidobacteriota bacterium]
MKTIGRRFFFRSLLTGGVLAGTGAARAAQSAPQNSGNTRSPSRRMDEMTSREIEFYLKSGGDLVLIPFGPISGHGALITVGMHAHWAHALSLLIAERADGLVFPVTHCCFAGATRTFRGTVSFTYQEQVMVLKRIASTLNKQGFRRTVLVGGTNPEDTAGMIAARELFDETEKPVFFVSARRAFDLPEVQELWRGYPGSFEEQQIDLAALRILGRERPIPMEKWSKEIKTDKDADQPDEIAPDVNAMRKWGAVGWRYFEEKNHGNHGNAGIIFNGRSDIDIAVDVLRKSADVIVPALASFEHYSKWLEQHPMQYISPTERLQEK